MSDKYCVFVSVLVMDEYYDTAYWPKEGDKTFLRSTGKFPGGSVANAASVCAGYGGKSRFYDVIGRNETSELLIQDLKERGIDTQNISVVEGLTTPRCMIINSPSERTIFAMDFNKVSMHLNEDQKKMFEEAAYIYTMPMAISVIEDWFEVLSDCKSNGCRVVFDIEHKPEDEEKIYGCASVLSFNEFGFESARGDMTEEEFIKYLFGYGVEILVVTLGAEGCRIISKAEDFKIDAYHIKPLDTNGAGDTFNAAFVYSLMEDRSLREAGEFATAAAAYCLTVKGARGGVADEETVRKFAEENKSLHKSFEEMNRV